MVLVNKENNMINFTVGPVMSGEEVLAVSGQSSPYFRTKEFSDIMLQNENIMLKFLHAPKNSRCVFLTSSGTGAMESCVMNILNKDDKVIVVNGGTFGQRFAELCELHSLIYTEIKCKFGEQIRKEQLDELDGKGYTALLVNMHETSSGVLYNMNMLSEFCKKNDICLIVDAISAFIADELDMEKLGAAAVITGSQKALAVHPGVSIIALSESAINRVESNTEKCLYLSLKEALKNMERGQTPFTPAVTILLQINARLVSMLNNGGIDSERQKIRGLALYFRNHIKEFPFEYVVENDIDQSNAITSLRTTKKNAVRIFEELKDNYGIWICPNGGIYKDDIFRVGHIGNLNEQDYDRLFAALTDLKIKGII